MSSDLERTADTRDGSSPEPRERVGRFELIEVLGGGGMGRVYLSRDSRLSRDVALKLIRSDARDEVARERFEREAMAMAQLSHPNLVTIYDVGSDGDELFIAMEYVPGGNLSKWLRAERRDWRDIVGKFMAAGRGLVAAHDAGIVHRDFKPTNVLVSERGTVHVTDFGIAVAGRAHDDGERAQRDGVPLHPGLTADGASVGTPRYMSPEQHLHETVDARSDQWSLAVALTEALTGEHPFPGADYVSIRKSATEGEPLIAERTIPRSVEVVLRRAMARDPAARYPTLSAMLDDLGRAMAERRRRWPVFAALGAIVVAGAATFAVAGRTSGGTPSTDAAPMESAVAGANAVRDAASPPVLVDAGVEVAATAVADAAVAPKKTEPRATRKKINLRPAGQACRVNHTSKTCGDCCKQPDFIQKPYPDCACYFDGDKWDREHGKKGVAPPLDPRIEWRPRGMGCAKSHDNESCVACCRWGDTLKPYPDCGCYFDGAKWDREHGGGR